MSHLQNKYYDRTSIEDCHGHSKIGQDIYSSENVTPYLQNKITVGVNGKLIMDYCRTLTPLAIFNF